MLVVMLNGYEVIKDSTVTHGDVFLPDRSNVFINNREDQGHVWPSGKAGKRKDLGSIPLLFSFLFKKIVVCGQSCDFVTHN